MSEPPTIPPSRRMSKISRVLARAGLRPDRRFGQSFLVNQGALEAIVRVSGAGPGTAAVEIGAGLGNLTDLLAKAAEQVVAVELDQSFRAIHEEYFAGAENIRFVYGDFLELPLAQLMPEGDWLERIVVGNIPFNITSRILMRLLGESEALDRAYILMQSEVADRLRAGPGSKRYSVLTAKLRCVFTMAVKFRISGRSFLPPPRVDSALVELRRHSRPLATNPVERAEFFAMLDGAFGQRRKTVANALSHASGGQWARDDVAAQIARLGLDPRTRAEDLESAQLFELFRALRENLGPASIGLRRRQGIS